LTDILNITESQARILRAIAYYEIKSKQKGVTQYACSRKVPKKYQVSDSTFNDNIKKLQKSLRVIKLKKKGKSKPVTITDIGQIAWLKYFSLDKTIEHIEIIKKIFPHILISEIDLIINDISVPEINLIKDKYAANVLKIALDSFHLEQSYPIRNQNYKDTVNEIIDLSSDDGHIKTSFYRDTSVIHPSILSKIKKSLTKQEYDVYYAKNYDELEISIIDRITFLFYYILIQSVMFEGYAENITLKNILIKSIEEKDNNFFNNIERYSNLPSKITKKKKEIMKIVTSKEPIMKIIKNNFEQLKSYKNTDFQKIYDFFVRN